MGKEVQNHLSLAVLSDLHAFDKHSYGDEPFPSYLDISTGEGREGTQPVTALKKLINKENLKADILVCAGDMGDKANPGAIQYAWTKIHELKGILDSPLVIATPGNHDHDSRSVYCKFDPRGALQTLAPLFPLQDEQNSNKFWAANFAIIKEPNFRLVSLNSSAFHGINDESSHGRVSPYALEKLENELGNQTPPPPVNILVCHHHPHKHEELCLSDYECMEGGQNLLSILGDGRFGEWLVIHGHKHFPKISYAQGFTAGPIVFSAGSLCAILDPSISTKVKNQFYMIEFDLDIFGKFGFVGRFLAWDWVNGCGWIPATSSSGLPSSGGFGYRTQLGILSDKIAAYVHDAPKKEWLEMTAEFPELNYLIPGDLDILEKLLSTRHSLKTVKSSDGLIIQIGQSL